MSMPARAPGAPNGPSRLRLWGPPLVVSLCLALPLCAAPRLPSADSEVLERLPGRANDPRARALTDARRQSARKPNDLAAAEALVRRYLDEVAAEGDPRYIGYAQAALAPWWNLPEPPPVVRVLRAVLRQFNHEFDAALSDLAAVLKLEPNHAEALSWQAAIAMVQARYADARVACERLAPQTTALIAVACMANVDSVVGRAGPASAALGAALAKPTSGDAEDAPAQRLWALTRLAEIEERRGEWAAAQARYRQALAIDIADTYVLAAYADFLLDRNRPNEVLALLKDKQRSDLLLLRLALAAQAAAAPELAGWTRELSARFDAARLRGDNAHQKEEARFTLAILARPDRALTLAQANYAVQREPADARMLLEAALAARAPQAAAPALKWLTENQVESVALRVLARQFEAPK